MICQLCEIGTRANSGRSLPVRVGAVAPDGRIFEAFMKGPAFGDRPFNFLLEREWVAAKLALELSLPCAYPIQIQVDPLLVGQVADLALQRALIAGPDVLFGSVFAGPGWHEWTDAISLPRDSVQQAAEIYLFDTIVQNWDRSVVQPNLLARGSDLMMIDHGEAFTEATGTELDRGYMRPPWHLGALSNASGADDIDRHALWLKLRPKTQVCFEAAAQKWKELPDDAFTRIAASVPDCWDRQATQRITSYLRDAVENLDTVVSQIKHSFAK